jgi:hypothetical protein
VGRANLWRPSTDLGHDDPGSHVINLTRGPDGKNHWIYVGLPGHDGDKGRELDEATLNRVHMPRTFFDDVKAALVPGATILVTQSSVGPLHGSTYNDPRQYRARCLRLRKPAGQARG